MQEQYVNPGSALDYARYCYHNCVPAVLINGGVAHFEGSSRVCDCFRSFGLATAVFPERDEAKRERERERVSE